VKCHMPMPNFELKKETTTATAVIGLLRIGVRYLCALPTLQPRRGSQLGYHVLKYLVRLHIATGTEPIFAVAVAATCQAHQG